MFRGTCVFALWIEDRSRRRCYLMFKRQLSDVIECTALPATVHKAALSRAWSDPAYREWTGRHPTWSDVGQLVLTPTSTGAFIVKRFRTCDTNLTMTFHSFFFPKILPLTWLQSVFFFFSKEKRKEKNTCFLVYSLSCGTQSTRGVKCRSSFCVCVCCCPSLAVSKWSRRFSRRLHSNEVWIIFVCKGQLCPGSPYSCRNISYFYFSHWECFCRHF